MQTQTQSYFPEGRLVPVFSANESLSTAALTLALSKSAAKRGETVLMVDCQAGALMKEAGIIYGKSLSDVLFYGADLRDAKYVTSNEHFTAIAAGDATLSTVLGSLAAMSLEYDWVFVGTEAGCTSDHVRLAGAADNCLLAYDTEADNFMRAYWMIDAVRRRFPKFDPHMLSMGQKETAVETALALSELVSDVLGARPPYAGHSEDAGVVDKLLDKLSKPSDSPLHVPENFITNSSVSTEIFM